jgi:hypothetical protein
VWGPNLPGFNCAPSQIKTTFYVKFCHHKRQAIMYDLADVFPGSYLAIYIRLYNFKGRF